MSVLLPGSVAGVCDCEVADPQLVHDTQRAQAAVEGMTPLHPDQAGRLVLVEGVSDPWGQMTWGRRKLLKWLKLLVQGRLTLAAGDKREDFWVFVAHSVNHIYLLQRLPHSIFVLSVAGHIGGPELRGTREHVWIICSAACSGKCICEPSQ